MLKSFPKLMICEFSAPTIPISMKFIVKLVFYIQKGVGIINI